MVGVYDELPYAAIVASAHGMQNKGLREKGNQRLGQNVGERAQAGTQPGAENKRTVNAEAGCDVQGTSLLGERLFFKQKTAYEISRSDWSSDVCSSDLLCNDGPRIRLRSGSRRSGNADDGKRFVGNGKPLEREN